MSLTFLPMQSLTLKNLNRLLCAAGLVALACGATNGTSEHKSAFSAGQKAPAFQAKTTEGKTVKFPDDYKGKLVLLDFWATWCGPCRMEMPNVVAAYQEYHSKNFDVLGISLDRPQQGPKLIKFTQENNMPWPQIYDGKYWQADLAVKYGIRSIPRPMLVDGDTGIILAEGPQARGHRLSALLEKSLAAKAKK